MRLKAIGKRERGIPLEGIDCAEGGIALQGKS